MTTEEILKEELEDLVTDLIKAYDQKGMRSSGQWADELEVRVRTNTAAIYGIDYSEQLEFGRKAGKRPPVEVIEQWIVDKGIADSIDREISIKSLAFLIARKIGNEGWKREEFGGVNLISEVITPERITKILNKVSDAKLIEVSSDLISIFTKNL